MNSGGGPERDDFGLPRVDVVIPDDARELDRDVQAYHRELRVLRRRMLLRRMWAPLTRHGLVMPLIASCLALTLLAGTLLTLFTAGRAAWIPAAPPRSPGAPAASRTPQGGPAGRPLPDGNLVVGGQDTPLRGLPPSVLAVVPPNCRCAAALRQLASQTAAAGAFLYLVGAPGTPVAALARQPGLRAAQPAEDPTGLLKSSYRLTGLAAILVGPSRLVTAVIRARNGRLPLGTALSKVVPGGMPA